MTALQECAQTLTRLYLERKNLQVSADHVQAALNLRELVLVPADGWPGKNEAQRETARSLAFMNDKDYQDLGVTLSGIRDALAEVEATISGVQETVSAERWRIRDDMAQALKARYHGEHVEDAEPGAPEFDEALQGAADEAVAESAAEVMVATDEGDEIPF